MSLKQVELVIRGRHVGSVRVAFERSDRRRRTYYYSHKGEKDEIQTVSILNAAMKLYEPYYIVSVNKVINSSQIRLICCAPKDAP